MTINPDIIYAILSLDSYNRGYEAGIDFLSAEIGNYSVRVNSIMQLVKLQPIQHWTKGLVRIQAMTLSMVALEMTCCMAALVQTLSMEMQEMI